MLEVARAHQSHFPADALSPAPRAAEPLSFRTLFDVARRRWLVIGLALGACLALGVAYIVISPAKYAATVTLLIDFRRAQLSQNQDSASIVDQAAVDSQIELLRSEKIILAVINKLDLINDPEFGRPSQGAKAGSDDATADRSVLQSLIDLPHRLLSRLRAANAKSAMPDGGAADGQPAKDPAAVAADFEMRRSIALVSQDLWVSRLGHSYLVSVTFNSADPVKASLIANDVAEAYISDQIGAKVQSAKDENAWFTAQVSEMRARAAQAYRAVQAFKAEQDINPLRDFGVEQDIDKLTSDASRARAAAAKTRAGLDRASSLLNGPLQAQGSLPDGTVLRSFALPEIDQLVTRYSALQIAQSGDPSTTDAEMQRTVGQEKIAIVGQIWSAIGRVAEQDKKDWIAAYAQQQTLESRLADIKLRDTRARLIQERLRELETTAATSRSLYESYLNQLTHAAQQQPVPASDARVITAATVPLYPSSPKVPFTLVLAALAGLGLGVTLTYLLESTDDVIRTREQLEAASNLTYLGIVPKVRMPRGTLRRENAVGNLQRFGPALFLRTGHRRSSAAQTLQSLRLAADVGLNDVSAAVIGITSAVAGEGKSTIAVNLAISAASTGRRVLLIDCNARNATLTAVFGPSAVDGPFGAGSGFSLKGIVATDDGVAVLTMPPSMLANGSDLPDIHALAAALTEARGRYDYIVLDLPPILPLGNVKAVINLVDVVVMVTRWGKTTIPQVERALSIFPASDRLLGLVFNGVRLRAMRRFEGSRALRYADQA